MKKLCYVLLVMILLSGCNFKDMSNTPTRQTEIFLDKYKTLDKSVMDDLNKVVIEEEGFNAAQREVYREVMKKHYQNLDYTIKEQTIDGDKAFVTLELEVTDYSRVLHDANLRLSNYPEEFQTEEGEYDSTKYMDYRLEEMKKSQDRVKYTFDLPLTKVDGTWKVDALEPSIEEKINGVHNY